MTYTHGSTCQECGEMYVRGHDEPGFCTHCGWLEGEESITDDESIRRWREEGGAGNGE